MVGVDALLGPVSLVRRREPFFFRQEDGQLKRIRDFNLSLAAPLDRCLRIGFVMIRLTSSLLSSKRHLVDRRVCSRGVRLELGTLIDRGTYKKDKTVALPIESLGEDRRGEHRRPYS